MVSIFSRLWSPPGGSDDVKPVVRPPGDLAVCCDVSGLLRVNDVVSDEPYLYPGGQPSDLTLEVTGGAGRIEVMSQPRGDSADSRVHLGGPGAGTVPPRDVIDNAGLIVWPQGRVAVLPEATPSGPRPPAPRPLADIAAGSRGARDT